MHTHSRALSSLLHLLTISTIHTRRIITSQRWFQSTLVSPRAQSICKMRLSFMYSKKITFPPGPLLLMNYASCRRACLHAAASVMDCAHAELLAGEARRNMCDTFFVAGVTAGCSCRRGKAGTSGLPQRVCAGIFHHVVQQWSENQCGPVVGFFGAFLYTLAVIVDSFCGAKKPPIISAMVPLHDYMHFLDAALDGGSLIPVGELFEASSNEVSAPEASEITRTSQSHLSCLSTQHPAAFDSDLDSIIY